jgi:hypothetical protein
MCAKIGVRPMSADAQPKEPARCLALWRNNKDATARVRQIDFGCLGSIRHFGVIRASRQLLVCVLRA